MSACSALLGGLGLLSGFLEQPAEHFLGALVLLDGGFEVRAALGVLGGLGFNGCALLGFLGEGLLEVFEFRAECQRGQGGLVPGAVRPGLPRSEAVRGIIRRVAAGRLKF